MKQTREAVERSIQHQQHDVEEEQQLVGETACYSGSMGGTRCGTVLGFREANVATDDYPTLDWVVSGLRTHEGDSGSPVWLVKNNGPIGMLSAEGGLVAPLLEETLEENGEVVGTSPGALKSLGERNALVLTGG
jgi:hypothetical protein